MRNLFDQLAKTLGKEALAPCGTTTIQREISRDAQHADLLHEPDPTRGAERAKLGLLGRLASVLCLMELYAHSPSGAEVRAVLTVLRVRGIAVPDAARERVLAEKDTERLEQWHERAIVAASITDVLGEPS